MTFRLPTTVYSEADCIARHIDEIAAFGKHALIVTGKSAARLSGALDDTISALTENHQAFTLFCETEENPSVETVMKAAKNGIAAHADFVIGIGGGSPMDAAKAAALMINRPDADWQALYIPGGAAPLPVLAIPTTCGTGSEVTGVSVLTRHDLKTKLSVKHKIFPALALIDGKYLRSAPRKILVNTAIDALAHLIESCINTQADCFSDMCAFAGLRLLNRCRPLLEADSVPDEEGAQNLMNAAAMAGMAIAQTGTSLPHALSYYLTYSSGIPHGPACGVFLANYLALADAERRRAVLEAAGFRNTDALRTLISSLAPVQADRAILEESAARVLQNPEKLRICPFTVDENIMQAVIHI